MVDYVERRVIITTSLVVEVLENATDEQIEEDAVKALFADATDIDIVEVAID